MNRVLITDGQERSVLAACRNLRGAGYLVDAAASEHPAATHWSRFCGRRISVDDPKDDPTGFVEQLRAIVGGGGYDILIPGADASLLAISRNRERLEPFVTLGLPAPEIVERSISKAALSEYAPRVGLPVPETAVCAEPEATLRAATRLGYPVMLKSEQAVFERDGGLGKQGSAMVHDEASLVRLLPEYGRPWLVQQVRPGTLLSFAGVAADGRLLACAVSRYRRTWPPEAGSVAFSETTSPSRELRDKVGALVAALGWQGMFELELVESRGALWAIDFNPRPYGSLALAGAAGAPLPVAWCEWLQGRNGGAAETARPGYHYRWDEAEIRNLWWLLRRRRIGAALSLIRPHRRTVHAHLWLSDPLPLLARAIVLLHHRRRHLADRKASRDLLPGT
jgi:predicted ATP-grasp superfamily ATP-dependent carboligase